VDIGNPGADGSFSRDSGVYTVKGDGEDIWGPADSFHYVYAPLSGDGYVTARVVSIQYTNEWAKAGVMIRETLEPGSKHAMLVVTPNGRRSYQWRATTNDNMGHLSSDPGAVALPFWVKMERTGNTLTGYYAADSGGSPGAWQEQTSQSITMGRDVYAGLCVTSHAGGTLCTAVFDNVSGSSEAANKLSDAMLNVNASLWARTEFTLEEGQGETFDTFSLRMKYDDGFVAYLNGNPVAWDNNPSALKWNSAAPADRPSEDSETFRSFNLMPYRDVLQGGMNVLAIHALNDNKSNDEFMLLPELVWTSESGVHQYFVTPTPRSYNITGAIGAAKEVWFSHERGFYNSAFNLTLSTETTDATIRYTTDGSTPSAGNGTVYVEGFPIPIGKTTCVRAVALKTGFLDSPVMTHTYIFLSDVKTQSPSGQLPGPGWPANGAVNGHAMDYGMDPDIVNNSTWGPQMSAALLAIPSVSVVTDIENLFDPANGIYVNPGGRGPAWERPASVELINPDQSDAFQVNAGLRIRGGYSRGSWNPKHAFRLFFRSVYGEANLRFPLFGEEGTDKFDKVDLRTSQNYSWSHGGSGHNTMVREVWSRDMQGAMGHPYTCSRYYHLYLNGQYWGLYQTQERSESAHAEQYMGGEREDYDVVKADGAVGRRMNAIDGNRHALDRLYHETMAGLDDSASRCRGPDRLHDHRILHGRQGRARLAIRQYSQQYVRHLQPHQPGRLEMVPPR